MLRGVLDIGFSSYTVPTYDLVSEYFRVQEPRLGVGAKDVQQGYRHSVVRNTMSFGVW